MDCTKCGGRGEYYGIGSTGRFRDEPMMRDCDRCGRTGIEPGTSGATATGSAPAGGCLSMLFGWLAGWLARIVMALVGLAVLGAIVFGFSWWKSRNHGLVEARPSSEVTTEGYAIGTCLNDPFGAALPVDCGQPHEAEVYRILEAKDPETEAYPGNGRLDDFAAATCPEHFEDYVGATPADADLSIGSRGPTETEWRIGSRRVLCFAGGGPNGNLTGAIAGSGGRAGGQ